jgi:hypothetical protein
MLKIQHEIVFIFSIYATLFRWAHIFVTIVNLFLLLKGSVFWTAEAVVVGVVAAAAAAAAAVVVVVVKK